MHDKGVMETHKNPQLADYESIKYLDCRLTLRAIYKIV